MDDLIGGNAGWNSSSGWVIVFVSNGVDYFQLRDTVFGGIYLSASTGCCEYTWNLGLEVAYLGDWDGDGAAEFAVGLPRVCYDCFNKFEGEIRIYQWDVTGDSVFEESYSPGADVPYVDGHVLRGDWTGLRDLGKGDTFIGGFDFTSAGELGGNKAPDLAVSGRIAGGAVKAARIYYYDQVSGNVAMLPDLVPCSDEYGGDVSLAGLKDTDGDRYDELAIAGYNSGSNKGIVELYSAEGGWSIRSARKDIYIGDELAKGGGDADGDGFDDLLSGIVNANEQYEGDVRLCSGDPVSYDVPTGCEYMDWDSVTANWPVMCEYREMAAVGQGLGEELLWLGNVDGYPGDEFAAVDFRFGADGLRRIAIMTTQTGSSPCIQEIARIPSTYNNAPPIRCR